jgi:hypothetical protein
MNNEITVCRLKQLYLNVEETLLTFVWSSWGKRQLSQSPRVDAKWGPPVTNRSTDFEVVVVVVLVVVL